MEYIVIHIWFRFVLFTIVGPFQPFCPKSESPSPPRLAKDLKAIAAALDASFAKLADFKATLTMDVEADAACVASEKLPKLQTLHRRVGV